MRGGNARTPRVGLRQGVLEIVQKKVLLADDDGEVDSRGGAEALRGPRLRVSGLSSQELILQFTAPPNNALFNGNDAGPGGINVNTPGNFTIKWLQWRRPIGSAPPKSST
jgi:hypothetical protein